MPKRTPKTDFEKRLRAWQKAKDFYDKEAAEWMGVELSTYRHWLYHGVLPAESYCRACIERKLNEA